MPPFTSRSTDRPLGPPPSSSGRGPRTYRDAATVDGAARIYAAVILRGSGTRDAANCVRDFVSLLDEEVRKDG